MTLSEANVAINSLICRTIKLQINEMTIFLHLNVAGIGNYLLEKGNQWWSRDYGVVIHFFFYRLSIFHDI